MAKYPGAQGPSTIDGASTRPAVGVHQSDPVWRWGATTGQTVEGKPQEGEMQSERPSVGVRAKPLRTSHRQAGDMMAAGADGVRGCQLLGEIGTLRGRSLGRRT
jgi:hypothetical protein